MKEPEYNPIVMSIKYPKLKFINFLIYPDFSMDLYPRDHLGLYEKLLEFSTYGNTFLFDKLNYAVMPEKWIPHSLIRANQMGIHTANIFYVGTIVSQDELELMDKILDWKEEISNELENIDEKFVVAGDIINKGPYPSLRKSFMLVDIENYIIQGCPKFTVEPEIHYNYCCTEFREFKEDWGKGLWPENEESGRQIPPVSLAFGSPLMSEIMSWGTPIIQLPIKKLFGHYLHTLPWQQNTSKWKDVYCYPDKDQLTEVCNEARELEDGVQTYDANELDKLIPPHYGGTPVSFILNTEDYIEDVPKGSEYDNWKLQNLYVPAAGFKYLNFLELVPHNTPGNIIFYDYNKTILDLTKHRQDNWDGKEDLKEFYEKHDSIMVRDFWVDYHWERDLKHYGNFEPFFNTEFKANWKYQFHCVDIIHELDAFLNIVEDKPGTLVFFSNIFDFIQNWIGGNLIVFEAWIKMIRHFQGYENDIMIYGSDPLRNNVWDFVKNIESIRPHRLHTWEI